MFPGYFSAESLKSHLDTLNNVPVTRLKKVQCIVIPAYVESHLRVFKELGKLVDRVIMSQIEVLYRNLERSLFTD